MDIRLDGRAALITGGSEGLGKGMALKFAEFGADSEIIARRQEVLDAAKDENDSVWNVGTHHSMTNPPST